MPLVTLGRCYKACSGRTFVAHAVGLARAHARTHRHGHTHRMVAFVHQADADHVDAEAQAGVHVQALRHVVAEQLLPSSVFACMPRVAPWMSTFAVLLESSPEVSVHMTHMCVCVYIYI